MTEKRLIVDEDYNIVDTLTGEGLDENQMFDLVNELHEENEQLKKEIVKFKEKEKHIRDVKKEVLDRVFKMSIYEITDAFEYYRKR